MQGDRKDGMRVRRKKGRKGGMKKGMKVRKEGREGERYEGKAVTSHSLTGASLNSSTSSLLAIVLSGRPIEAEIEEVEVDEMEPFILPTLTIF